MESTSIRPKRGRPRKRPVEVHADTKRDMPLVRSYLYGKRGKSQTQSSTNRKRRRRRPDRLSSMNRMEKQA